MNFAKQGFIGMVLMFLAFPVWMLVTSGGTVIVLLLSSLVAIMSYLADIMSKRADQQ